MKALLIHVRPLDLATNARVDIRLGSAASAAALGLGGFAWESAISRRPRLSRELFSEALDGRLQPGRGDLILNLNHVRQHASPPALYWVGAPVIIYDGDSLDLATAPLLFTGHVRGAPPDLENGRITLNLEVSAAKLQRPALWRAFTGGGGMDGEPEMRGTPKPSGFGACFNIEPVFYDRVRNLAMLDGYGNLLEVTWLGEGGATLGPRFADYSSEGLLANALDAGTVPDGRWATSVADGVLGLGAPPVGVITCDALFEHDRPGAWMRRLIEHYAKVPVGEIDTASFAALDVAVDRPVAHFLREQRDTLDLIEAIAASCNATPLLDFRGRVAISRPFGGALVGTLERGASSTPRVTAWEAGDPEPPVWRTTARAARPGRQLTDDEVNYEDDLIDRGAFRFDETYRQGNLVWLADDSQWLYVNPTATKGNLPADGSAYWVRKRDAEQKNGLYDAFNYSSVEAFKARWPGLAPDAASFFGGDLAILPLSTTPGGTFLSLGDNIGSDYVQAVLGEAMPYAPEDLHVIEYDWEVGAGSGGATTYLGVVPLDKDGNNLQCDAGTYAYAAGIFEQGANIGRKRRAGYFRGVAASASQGGPGSTVGIPAPDAANPCPLPIGTVNIRPVFLANYPGGAAAGGCAAHEMRCAKIEDATVISAGEWVGTRSYFRNEGTNRFGRYFGSKANANLNNPPPSTATSNAWWYLIADRGAPGAPGQDGAGSFTLIRNDLNTEITTPSSLKKVDGGGDWNTGGFSQEAYVNGAFVSARAGQTTDYLMFGLNQNGSAFGGYLDIDFAIFFNPGGVVRIYEEGTARPEESAYTTGDVFSVHYNGSTVVYAKNGVAFRTVAAAANLRLQFDCSFYSPGAALTNIVFSPAGPAGEDGNFLDVKYLRSFSQPATPSGSQPVGYSDSIPDGNGFVYETTALKAEDDTLLTPWSVPALRSEAAPAVDYNDTSTFFQRQLVKFAGGIYVLAVASSTGFAPSGTAQANARWDVYIPPAEVPPPTPPSGYVQTINLTSSAAMVNLRSIADAHTTPYPGGNATIEFVVPNGVTIAGGVGQAAIDSGTWPSSSYAIALKLTVAAGGIVRGGGGRGGNGASGLGTPGNGQAGGDALFLREHFSNGVSISGVVQAGGGGGGGGRGDRVYFNGEYLVSGGGGGGGGAPNGGGGNAGFSDAGGSSAGSAGTPGGGGAGGTGENAGGAGGALGVAGSDSAGGLDRGIGGAAGFAVRKNGRTATVSGGGTITGAVG